jgi:hypothetical protein
MSRILATILMLCQMVAIPEGHAGAKENDVRARMTKQQRIELRRRATDWCKNNYLRGLATIQRVEILRDGRVRCWIRS